MLICEKLLIVFPIIQQTVQLCNINFLLPTFTDILTSNVNKFLKHKINSSKFIQIGNFEQSGPKYAFAKSMLQFNE